MPIRTTGRGSANVPTVADVTTDPDTAARTVPTLRERMRAAGLSDARIAAHAAAQVIALDGELVTDLDQPMASIDSRSFRRPDSSTRP